MRSVRPRYVPLPFQDSLEAGRLILRDGTTATIRLAQLGDKEAMIKFFASLSSESKRRRFFGFAAPADKLVESLCDPSNPRVQLSLVVTRLTEDGFRIIATGNYVAPNETVPLYTKPVMKHLRGQEYDLVRDLIFGLGTRPPKGTGARKLWDQHAESLRRYGWSCARIFSKRRQSTSRT